MSLIDVALAANLVVIVVFSGYENFVSRIDSSGYPGWPVWMTHIDFSGLKQKVLASIVAISAVQVLKAFMNLDATVNTERLAWFVGIHVVFVVSTLLLACRIGSASIAANLNWKVERVEPSGAPLFWLFRSAGAAAPGSSLDNAPSAVGCS